jgi:uncharacterized protein (DUF2267 family)
VNEVALPVNLFEHDWTPEFGKALSQAMEDHQLFDEDDLRPVGVDQEDANALVQAILLTFRKELTAGEPETMARAVSAGVELALSIGVHLERGRWDAYERATKPE